MPELQAECFFATLFIAISRTGVLFMWPVKVPASDGKTNEWHTSAATAAQRAMKSWVRVKSNMDLGAYEIFEAEGSIPDPTWPDLSFDEIYPDCLQGQDNPRSRPSRRQTAAWRLAPCSTELPFKRIVAIDFEFDFGGHDFDGSSQPVRRTAAAGLHGGERAAQRPDLATVGGPVRIAAAVPAR